MTNFRRDLEKYAELAVKVGLNLQQGQKLVISASIEATPLVRNITKKAYEIGAKDVLVNWSDDEISLIKYMNAPYEAFEEFPMWKANGLAEMAKEGAAFLGVAAPNPDLLKHVDPKKIAISRKTSAVAMKELSTYTRSGKVNWSAIVFPTKEWASKIYPDINEEEGVQKLWESIFKITRVDMEDPVNAWKEHSNNLKTKLDYLNRKKYRKLFYKGTGTDLTVELPDNQVWVGGRMTTEKGIFCVPNIPTEEVFTAPMKTGVNGTVRSTLPLVYSGSLIENFSFTFKNGKIVDFSAEKGYEVLKSIIETDEGASFLGEVALVPYDSPISNTNTIFYNTLIDENASSHFAIGAAYPSCIEKGSKMSKEELEANNINTSLTHVDFMVGSSEINIDGETKEGTIEPIFRNGNWAIEI